MFAFLDRVHVCNPKSSVKQQKVTQMLVLQATAFNPPTGHRGLDQNVFFPLTPFCLPTQGGALRRAGSCRCDSEPEAPEGFAKERFSGDQT